MTGRFDDTARNFRWLIGLAHVSALWSDDAQYNYKFSNRLAPRKINQRSDLPQSRQIAALIANGIKRAHFNALRGG